MRLLLLLAWALPLPALALGPAVLDSPDLRQLVAGPMVYGGSDGVTCAPVPGVGRCTEGATITPPAGLGWDPGLNVKCVGGQPKATVDVASFAPTGKTYFVGYAQTSDTFDGLTRATSFGSIAKALSMADAKVIMVCGGGTGCGPMLNKDAASFDIATIRDVAIIGDGGVVPLSMHGFGLAWSLESGTAYRTTRGATVAVYDAHFVDEWGDYRRLLKVADMNAVVATPGSWASSGSTVWVNTHDGRAPDAAIRLYISQGAQIRNGATVYLENLAFEGGGTLTVTAAPGAPTKVRMKNISFKYAYGSNGLNVLGADTFCQGCLAARNSRDGFNYHENAGAKSRNIEVDCTGRHNGNQGDTAGINNGSTTHDGQTIVRVGGRYFANEGPNLPDVNGAKTWNVGSVAFGSIAAGSQNSDFWTEGEMWCEWCEARASTWSLTVGGGGQAWLRGFRASRPKNVTGAVACY